MSQEGRISRLAKQSARASSSGPRAEEQTKNIASNLQADIDVLPDDVILALLLLLDNIQTFDNIVKVWPRAEAIGNVYEQQILASIIDKQLGLPVAQYAAACIDGPSACNKRNIGPVLRDYFKALFRPAPPERSRLKDWTLSQLQSVARAIREYQQSVELCLDTFLGRCSDRWPGPVPPTLSRDSLSLSEERRLLRAIYLYQLYCHCFASAEAFDDFEASYIEIHAEDQAIYFLANLPPWVVEEVYTIHEFMFNTYTDIIKEMDVVTQDDSTRLEQIVAYTDDRDHDSDVPSSFLQDYAESYVSLGVKCFAEAVRRKPSARALYSWFARPIQITGSCSLRTAAQHWSIVLYTERDTSWVTDSDESLDKPSRAWTYIYRQSDDYNEYLFEMELASHRPFGAIFWDAPRIHGPSRHFLKILTAQ